ncbi:MAG TPA: hypothetical protein VJW76_01065 [Verrucomicrobiae bacterium]|nr:hypothetical protein [Verrucomicrobiae bacterium]
MTLDEGQKQKVTGWIEEGLKLSEIQKRLDAELGVRMTYIEVRLLVDDLKLVPKDPAPVNPVEFGSPHAPAGAPDEQEAVIPDDEADAPTTAEEEGRTGTARVSVTVDEIARPGSLVSGSVTFSDGNSAVWYLDQYGRLGLAPQKQGYKPSAIDLQAFQIELQNRMAKMGF